MGLPTSIYAAGIGKVWIAVGLALGYTLSWITIAPRLRKFSIVSDDAITIPQYLTKRFKSRSGALQIVCAVVFLAAYTIYAASSLKACGTLFNTVTGIDARIAMYIAAVIIIGYTFLGGFSAVCWTDFFQGMLIFGAVLIVPIFAASSTLASDATEIAAQTAGYWSPFAKWTDILSGFGWGLGYFGMPHIIIRFMSLRRQKDMKKSAAIGITWTFVVLVAAVAIGIIGRMYLGFDETIKSNSTVFIKTVRLIFPGVISGILLSAVLAASMSTADSQLLAASSAFAADVYKPTIRKNKASDREMLWAGRIVVLAVAAIALIIAANPNSGSIMDLVENAWGIFGAAFGPTIILSLFWKRFNFPGAVAGIAVGAIADVCWLIFLSDTGVYEIIPGFICGLVAAIVVTLATKKPSAEVQKLFEDAKAYKDPE
jgi:sodium/proline symporter